jgi:drug/metabolite transporter (DMT)-like permease
MTAEASRTREGLLWGGLGVLAFSLTLPATRAAVPEMGGLVVGLGRALLALGGVAHVSQLQLLQPLLTLGWSALLLGEAVGRGTLGAALLVVGCVLATARSRVLRLPAPGAPVRAP